MDFKIYPKIRTFNTFAECADALNLGTDDLLFTQGFLHKQFMSKWSAQTLFYEDYSTGEPSDIIVDAMLNHIRDKKFKRIIAVGGGSILDCSKILAIKGAANVADLYDDKITPVRDVELIMLPTTCGTGCEVTGVSVLDFPNKGTKIGKRFECSFADEAILIGELIKGLPYDVFMHSSADALVHALEIYLAPKANAYSDIFCAEAIRRILTSYKRMEQNGKDARFEDMESYLIGSNMAGIALANVLPGAVHAMAMHFGSAHHVPHGESTRLFLMDVFSVYAARKPDGKIKDIAEIIAVCLNVPDDPSTAFEALKALLDKLLPVKPLSAYGMKDGDFMAYAGKVLETQQRLIINNYVELSQEELAGIYKRMF